MLSSMINRITRAIGLGAIAIGVVAGTTAVNTAVLATPAFASKSGTCDAFVAKIGPKTFSGDIQTTLSAKKIAGKTMVVDGTFIEFSVNLDTFAVTDYTLTGAPSEKDITGGVRTPVFASKTPQLAAALTGAVTLQLKQETILLKRGGRSQTMKITAKDCPQGGIFQMEAEPGTTYVHELAPGFTYYEDDLGRTLFTNGVVIGRESPELASLVSRTDTQSTWAVDTGGRMGGVFGEDATQ
jgi:hypothetical protein